ncbi:hypothetical protein [Amaricoccus sp.]|uniref:hypothetical protein n=1 Tax=Amaricoccus sp. TaxID=1872485 RepID=UPI001B5C5CE6|nr:hypothetical protein [Amaricoccus sp.]MBP7240491.1 hypothetical protein [Amaricoccus sp.]
MRSSFAIAVTLSALACAAPALAQSQLESNAGLTAEQARGLTLNEIATVKFNRGEATQDQNLVRRQVAVTALAFQGTDAAGYDQLAGAAGLSPEQAEGMTLDQIATAKFNRSESVQDQIPMRDMTSAMAFQDPLDLSTNAHLIRSAKLTPEEAQGMTLNEVWRIISPD